MVPAALVDALFELKNIGNFAACGQAMAGNSNAHSRKQSRNLEVKGRIYSK